eukprot:CAMPEP_0171099688 /NCGR_PEP_ID=MMETSP0766_2-20121228/52281_1 /TAXON_ID=439317 /ORGANISM="Gambierdiscus australes, Strain CAWD 149" /LENGTH=332 /DNA_ID=CAMNT_0011559361 /DNA_START=46 /DNA_END=1041 /DNA_ORIENTATION=-
MVTAMAKAASVAVAVVLAAILIPRVLSYRHRPFRKELPQFMFCETAWGQPCHPSFPTRWFEDFYGTLATRAGYITSSGRRPVVLHIGANDFRDDTIEYLPLLSALKATAGDQLRVVLVEPEQEKMPQLHEVHIGLGLRHSSVSVVEAAVKENCSEKEVLYVFSDKLFEDFVPLKYRSSVRSSLRSWKSFDPARPLQAMAGVSNLDSYLTGEGSSTQFDQFHHVIVPLVRKMYEAGNASKYLVEEPVACVTAETLMGEASMTPEDIIMVTVDAEGFDVEILSGLVKLPGFRPQMVRWEGVLSDSRHWDLVSFFQRGGWYVGATGHSHSYDIVT